jgi:NarL family two-component system response regulator LiaR
MPANGHRDVARSGQESGGKDAVQPRQDSRRADCTEARTDRVRTTICDDDPMARRVVRDALQDAGITVIAESRTSREAVELALYYRPDVVLMASQTGGLDALRATSAIAEGAPQVRVLMLSTSDDPELGLQALRAGASGYLSKEIDPQALAEVVRRLARGEPAVSPELTNHLIERVRAFREDGLGIRPVRSLLTSREWEVLDLLCAGENIDSIAEEFVLTVETVRSHVKNTMRKLGVHSQAEAVVAAQRLRSPVGRNRRIPM